MNEITSKSNGLIKELKKLQQKKYRDQSQRYVIEGFHLVEEAVRTNQDLEHIFVNSRGVHEWQNWLEVQQLEYTLVSDPIFDTLSDAVTPQGILAVLNMKEVSVDLTQGKWLCLDQVQDPGNVGTMIRTADAAGFSGVILGKGTVDLFHPKVLRSMQGSHFHLPVVQHDLMEVCAQFEQANVPIYGTELNEQAVDYRQVAPTTHVALILGNEGQGVRADLLERTTKNLYIPLLGEAESLNVGVAAGVLMYHFLEK